MIYIYFIYKFSDGQLGYFHILTIAYKTAMNLRVHISFWISVFVFFRYITRSEIAGSCGSFIFSVFSFFFFLRNNTIFSIMTAPQQGTKFPFSNSLLLLSISYLFDNDSSDRCEVIFNCGFIYISLIISDIKHLFMSLTVICIFSLEIYLFLCPF